MVNIVYSEKTYMISDDKAAEAAHNGLADTDDKFGRLQGYVAMAPHYVKLIKAKHFLEASGTVAEKESRAYSSEDYIDFMKKLDEAMVSYNVLDAQRATWQREIDIWRTISANRRR
jgi:hypothetical protein